MSTNIIQTFCFPSLQIGSPEEMYFRVKHKKQTRFDEKVIYFEKNESVTFDTFFNSFSVGVWKRNTSIEQLKCQLFGDGSFIIKFGLYRIGHAHKWLSEQTITLTNDGTIIDMPFWPSLEDGLLYLQMIALSDGEFRAGHYLTDSQPKREVKLGIVITHFNRKKYVLPAIHRIETELLDDKYFDKKIDLIVVDNSQNIEDHEAGIKPHIIPNKNLGGSGGFTRGLLYLEDNEYTHCLFMDDDASCEVESIRRTYSLLQYAKNDNIAIAGSMLRELEPYRLFEKGAMFNGLCQPLKSGLDMRSVADLLFADQKTAQPDYGGWWFFAFKISEVKHYAFPFFVRGDDIMFGLTNRFQIESINGVCCWGDDFGLKSGPMPIYLDTRNHLLQLILVKHDSLYKFIRVASQFYFASAFSYNYATARAVILALKNIQEGPNFWLNNLDMGLIRKEIMSYQPQEKMEPIDRSNYHPVYKHKKETKLRSLIRWGTLNGYLLPSFLLKKQTVFQHKNFRGKLRDIFRYESVIYEYEPLSLGYIAKIDKKLFFSLTIKFMKEIISIILNFNKIKSDYKNNFEYMTSRKLWEDIYK